MATVGQALTSPESGWKRFDDSDPNITYSNSNWSIDSGASEWYNSSYHQSNIIGATINFNFTGNKIRILSNLYSDKTNSAYLYIDKKNIATINEYSSSEIMEVIVAQVLNLSNAEHCVSIVNNASGYLLLDAIDINENGILKPYNEKLKKNIF
jgi:hypothetical protein